MSTNIAKTICWKCMVMIMAWSILVQDSDILLKMKKIIFSIQNIKDMCRKFDCILYIEGKSLKYFHTE